MQRLTFIKKGITDIVRTIGAAPEKCSPNRTTIKDGAAKNKSRLSVPPIKRLIKGLQIRVVQP